MLTRGRGDACGINTTPGLHTPEVCLNNNEEYRE